MNEIRDPRLADLFDRAHEELDGEGFTDRVMHRSRFLKYRSHAIMGSTTLILLVAAHLLVPPLRELSLMISWGLTTSLLDLGDGWFALVASPVNTLGGLLVFCLKVGLLLRKWVRRGIHLR